VTGPGYQVDPAELARHAAEVGQLGERLENASSFAVPLSSSAFGLVGAMFAGRLIETSGGASVAIARLAAQARADQAALLATAAGYLARETELGRRFDDLATGAPDDPASGVPADSASGRPGDPASGPPEELAGGRVGEPARDRAGERSDRPAGRR
jgi:hypothetical protein